MTKKKKIKTKKFSGFTLIELIIVMAVIGILAGAVAISMTSSSNDAKLEAAQREVVSEIKLAQAYTLQGKTQDKSGSLKTPCGYGVHFLSNTDYEIFYNFPSGSYDCDQFNSLSSDSRKFVSGTSLEMSAKTLSYGARFSARSDVYFTVPNGTVYGSTGDALLSSSVLIIRYGSSATRDITISKNGLVIAGQ